MGVDPGSRFLGVGIIHQTNPRSVLFSKTLTINPQLTHAQRLNVIFSHINLWIKSYQPHVLILEKVFSHINVQSALILGQVRGVILLSADQNQLPLFEYSPNQVKQTICGHGHASKTEIQKMISVELNISQGFQCDDEADALALALTHALLQRMNIFQSHGSSQKKNKRQSWTQFVLNKN